MFIYRTVCFSPDYFRIDKKPHQLSFRSSKIPDFSPKQQKDFKLKSPCLLNSEFPLYQISVNYNTTTDFREKFQRKKPA